MQAAPRTDPRLAEEERATVHIAPSSTGRYVGLEGGFTLAVVEGGEISLVDNVLGGHVMELPEDLAQVRRAWEAVLSEALPRRQSKQLNKGSVRSMEEFEFHKSTRSGTGGDCVEVADNLPGIIGVRDSKDPTGPVLIFDREAFREFLAAVKRGEMDL